MKTEIDTYEKYLERFQEANRFYGGYAPMSWSQWYNQQEQKKVNNDK